MTNQEGPSPRPRARTSKKSESRSAEHLRAQLEEAVDFRAEMRDVMREVSSAGADAVAANGDSLKGYDKLVARTMTAIEKELDRPDLTPADRAALIDRMVGLVERRDAKDSENKGFLTGVAQDRMKVGLMIAGGLGAVAVAAVAGPEGIKQLGKLVPQVAKRTITS